MSTTKFVLNNLNLILNRDPEDADAIYEWILEQFKASYDNNRTPLVLLLNSAWFQYNSGALEAAER